MSSFKAPFDAEPIHLSVLVCASTAQQRNYLRELLPDGVNVNCARPDENLADRYLRSMAHVALISSAAATRQLMRQLPHARVVGVGPVLANERAALEVVSSGAVGYLPWPALRATLLPTLMAAAVLPQMRTPDAGPRPGGPDLDWREQRVLTAIAAGKTNPEIHAELRVYAAYWVKKLCHKFDAKDRYDLVRKAAQLGYLK